VACLRRTLRRGLMAAVNVSRGVAVAACALALSCDDSRAEDLSGATSACSALAICGPVYVQTPDAAEALRFAMKRFRAGQFDDPETLNANYLRRSDAEVLRLARAAAK